MALKLAHWCSCMPYLFCVIDTDGPTILAYLHVQIWTQLPWTSASQPSRKILCHLLYSHLPVTRPSCQRGISQAIWWMFWRHNASSLGEYHTTIDRAGALKEPLKKELDSLVQQEILVKVTKSTDWVDSLVCVSNSTWALRLCLDPRDLSQAIKRPHYFTPTLVDILPMSV